MTDEFIKAKAKKTVEILRQAHIILTEREEANIEICDYNLHRYDEIGTAIVIYVNTNRCCAKEMVLTSGQLCPEHKHPELPEYSYPGKEETFRCRWGEVYLYVEGEPCESPVFLPPADRLKYFTVWHEIILSPGEQYTLMPCMRHWFAAGPQGAIVSEFSTPSYDKCDLFTDSDILRLSNLTDIN